MTTPKPLSRGELLGALVARRATDHKGQYGHVLVAAGSRGMAGAAILAGRAALRSGAGLVTVAVPAGTAPLVAGAVPSAMTLALPENSSGIFDPKGVERLREYARARRATTLALGPGVTTHPDAARFVLRVLAEVEIPAVVDADALTALSSEKSFRPAQPCVFTPHPGEAARLLAVTTAEVESARGHSVEALARRLGGVVLLKGHKTLISSGTRTAVNPTGGPGLAKGGSGDVLTGLLAGLWAQMLASGRVTTDLPFKAAALAAWLHGKAGEQAEKEMTPWAVASSDLIGRLPGAFRALCG
ncbi:MAG: NAD(P)H-hydrate dehydratase [Elusimicrobiota bacterium]